MKKAFFLLALLTLVFACGKDPETSNPPCQNADGKGQIEIYNGFHVELRVFVSNTSPTATDTSLFDNKYVKTGETWKLIMPIGEYRFTAKGHEPPPYAHDEYNFEQTKTLGDCETLRIEY